MYIITSYEQTGTDGMWQASISKKPKPFDPGSIHYDCVTVIGSSLHECTLRAVAACNGLDAGI